MVDVDILLALLLVYMSLAFISHYGRFGSVIPGWLCVFCLRESVIKVIKKIGGEKIRWH